MKDPQKRRIQELEQCPVLKTKKAPAVSNGGFYKIRHRPTLPPVTAIPSALAGLTALFGMGRGGHRRYRHLKYLNKDINRKKTKERGRQQQYLSLEKSFG